MKNYIAELRKVNSISQLDLAKAVGVSRQSISALETERHSPSLRLANDISNYFDLEIGIVFDLSESPKESDNFVRDFIQALDEICRGIAIIAIFTDEILVKEDLQ